MCVCHFVRYVITSALPNLRAEIVTVMMTWHSRNINWLEEEWKCPPPTLPLLAFAQLRCSLDHLGCYYYIDIYTAYIYSEKMCYVCQVIDASVVGCANSNLIFVTSLQPSDNCVLRTFLKECLDTYINWIIISMINTAIIQYTDINDRKFQ